MPKTTECTASYTGLFSFDKEEHEWQMWRQDGWRPWRCSSVSFKAANTTQFSVSVKIRHEGRISTFNSVYQLYNRYWYQCSSVKKKWIWTSNRKWRNLFISPVIGCNQCVLWVKLWCSYLWITLSRHFSGHTFSLYQIYAVLRSVTSDLTMIMRITMIILVPEFRISSGSQK